jgi:RimJ/RimL family protein N-acetyltransferase
MSDERRIIETKRGPFVLRPERPEDDDFLFRLFRANNIDVLLLMGLPEEMVEQLIQFQYRSQTATYRGMFPKAAFSIIEWDGETIGRFIEHDEQDVVYFVDFVLVPERQSQGLGSAFIRAVMDEWGAHGRGTRVKILYNNDPSLKMCHKLGMVQSGPDEMGYVELRWYPPGFASTSSPSAD